MNDLGTQNRTMDQGKGRNPRQLNLVSMPSQLGDLSAMSAAERAELVEQDGRRRILEEMVTSEAQALRSFFWAGGICCSGVSVAVGSALILEQFLSPSYAHPYVLVLGLKILALVGGAAGVVGFYPAIWFGIRWIRAIVRRRRFLSHGELMRKR